MNDVCLVAKAMIDYINGITITYKTPECHCDKCEEGLTREEKEALATISNQYDN